MYDDFPLIQKKPKKKCTSLKTVIVPSSVTTMSADSFPSITILMVAENSYAHTYAQNNSLLYHIYDGTNEPEAYDFNNIRYYILDDEAIAVVVIDTTITEVEIR